MPFFTVFGGYYLFFCTLKKNIDQNNMCASSVFKAKTKEKYEEIFFKVFVSKLINTLF